MKTINLKSKGSVLGLLAVLSLLVGCGDVGRRAAARNPNGNDDTGPTPVSSTAKNYRQIERLARPAINEGLLITNDYLNAFNSIGPNLDLSPAAAPVVAEAAGVLSAVHAYGVNAGLPAPTVGDVAGGFLPDVMRIDTRNYITPGSWAYNGDAVIVSGTSAAAMLTAGRKIEDDVMDITLSYLIAGNPACGPNSPCTIPDGASYAGGTDCAHAGLGSNVANPGHKCLVGQTSRNGAASFPFLATPN